MALMSQAAYAPLLKTAMAAARAAGALQMAHLRRPRAFTTKRSPIDLVTKVDKACERLIQQQLQRAYPDFDFLGEERGQRTAASDYRWIVDPIDGTNNFVHGFPFFGVSIGLEYRGHMVVGVIYDATRDELFTAVRGGGARLNGRRIHVSPTKQIAHSLLSTGFSTNFLKQDQPYLGWFKTLQRKSHGIRRMGSTVLCLAALAAGRLEGFYEQDLWPWDIAAGILIVTEAGGRVSNLQGGPVVLTAGQLVATNGHIHRELLRLLHQNGDSH